MSAARNSVVYLQAMGIQVWESRAETLAPEQPEVDGLPLFLDSLQAVRSPLASVVVQWPGPLRLTPAHQAGALLLKILAALKQPLPRFAVYQLRAEPPAEWPPLPQPGRVLLLFAELPPTVCGALPIIVLPSLQRLLDDPQSKRGAWTLLRPWIEKLA